ncbi:MAG: hypothetical protein HKN81_04775 [Gammaproteobacteria bacterium]|nr:hypothetical protein [Gammaproteobacteria bacterium]
MTSIVLIAAVSGIPALAQMGGDASGQTFAEFCSGSIGADREATYYAEMDRADAAVAAGDLATAGGATSQAFQAVFRGGSYADDTSIRCLGNNAIRRWHDTHLEMWRRGNASGLEGRSGDFAPMYIVANDRGTKGLIEVATSRPTSGFRAAYLAIEQIIELDDWRRNFGSPVLQEETVVAKACRDALGPLEDYRKQEISRTLAVEDKAFNRPPTQQEKQAAAQMDQFGQLATVLGGAEEVGSAEDQKTLMMTERRTRESREYLNKARNLEWGARAADEKTATDLRAEQRGDILLARANEETRSLEVRDELYEEANRYFNFCKCHDKRRVTNAAKEAIQPALEAEAERRQVAMEKRQAEMEQQLESMKQEVDDMKKTDAEKKSFQDEADAMEAELGF